MNTKHLTLILTVAAATTLGTLNLNAAAPAVSPDARVFAGDKLLTAANPGQDKDLSMLESFGMKVEVVAYQGER